MNIAFNSEEITWRSGADTIRLALPNISSAIGDELRKQVYVLQEQAETGSWLVGLSALGVEEFRVRAPSGFQFGYVVHHPNAGPAVVLTANDLLEGWYDWHFAIGSDGDLSRHSPAY